MLLGLGRLLIKSLPRLMYKGGLGREDTLSLSYDEHFTFLPGRYMIDPTTMTNEGCSDTA